MTIKYRKPIAPPSYRMESDKDKDKYSRKQKFICQKCKGEGVVFYLDLDNPIEEPKPGEPTYVECDWC